MVLLFLNVTDIVCRCSVTVYMDKILKHTMGYAFN
jgi:hypothetical protein